MSTDNNGNVIGRSKLHRASRYLRARVSPVLNVGTELWGVLFRSISGIMGFRRVNAKGMTCTWIKHLGCRRESLLYSRTCGFGVRVRIGRGFRDCGEDEGKKEGTPTNACSQHDCEDGEKKTHWKQEEKRVHRVFINNGSPAAGNGQLGVMTNDIFCYLFSIRVKRDGAVIDRSQKCELVRTVS